MRTLIAFSLDQPICGQIMTQIFYEKAESGEVVNWRLYYFHGLNDDFCSGGVVTTLEKKHTKKVRVNF